MFIPPMFGHVRVTVAPSIADRMIAKNSAMQFRIPAKKFDDALEILLSAFDIVNSKPSVVATVQPLLSSAPSGAPEPGGFINPVGCVRLGVVKEGRKLALIKLMRILRDRSMKRTGESWIECVGDDASNEAIAAYWKDTVLKDFTDRIESIRCNAVRGLMTFEIKDGSAGDFRNELSSLTFSF